MINFKEITSALKTQIEDANTTARPYTIVRNKSENTDPNTAVEGWIGIYRDSVDYSPYSSGPQPWLAEVKIRVEIQAASFADEGDCEEKLDELLLFVEQAIESDRTIGGYVLMITGYDVDYDDSFATDQLQTFYQYATLTVTAEVRA